MKIVDLTEPIFELSANHLEWLEYKWSMIGNMSEMPVLPITFGKKQMEATFDLNEKGFCLINLGITKDNNSHDYYPIVAMIDTGAERSLISEEMAEFLQVENQGSVTINGIQTETSYYTTIKIVSNELGLITPIIIAVTKNKCKGVDLYLGCDFLKTLKFTRDGVNNTFTLSY